jgi:hypothetical protein
MVLVFRNVYCSSCGRTHMLCYAESDTIYSSRDYEFDCPQTRLPSRVPKGEWGEPANECPKTAVPIREVKS